MHHLVSFTWAYFPSHMLSLSIYTCVYVEKGRLGRHGEEVERRAKSSVGFFSSSCWCSADSGALI